MHQNHPALFPISPAGVVFKVGTVFRIDNSLKQKVIKAYSTDCKYEEKSIPVVLKKSRESKVIISKGQ